VGKYIVKNPVCLSQSYAGKYTGKHNRIEKII